MGRKTALSVPVELAGMSDECSKGTMRKGC
jgi:hypothetical protein